MIFSFGTLWRSEEQIIFLICSNFGDRCCCLCYIAYLGTENAKSYTRKEKAHILLAQHFSAILSENHGQKRMRGEKIFLDTYHNELGTYWYFQSILRLRGTETDQQAPSQLQGHLGNAFYRLFLPALSIAALAGWEQGQRSWGSEKTLVTWIQVLLLCTTFWTPQKINKPCWTSSLRRQ